MHGHPYHAKKGFMEGNNYWATQDIDIVEKLRPMFVSGSLYVRDDGKIAKNMKHQFESPWLFARTAPNRDCWFYMVIFRDTWKRIHSRCQSCWKVVVRPKTLEELMKLRNLQVELDMPAKCGIEVRDYVSGHYGGYFYADTMDEGKEIYRLVRERVSEEISPDTRVILKRGCTEFERDFGDSSKWSCDEYQLQIEKVLQEAFVQDVPYTPVPDYIVRHNMRQWVKWAYQNGDETYKLYTDGRPLIEPYVTYHEEAENG